MKCAAIVRQKTNGNWTTLTRAQNKSLIRLVRRFNGDLEIVCMPTTFFEYVGVVVPQCDLFLGIEPDGYTHS